MGDLTDKQALELIEYIAFYEGEARLRASNGKVEEDEIIGKIYKIAHSQNHLCKNSHKDWREENVALYRQMVEG